MLLEHLKTREQAMLAELRALVEHESPSRDKLALDELAIRLADRLRSVGGKERILLNPLGGNHLVAEFPGKSEDAKPILILGHFDTVWPDGTTASRPFRIEENRAFGPGIFDMKASLVLVFHALEALNSLQLQPNRPIVVLFTSDEEIGSPTSREPIETLAKTAESVLVIEPPLASGALKTARKGVGGFTVEIAGKSAHAGVEPEKGVNAILELSHQVVKIHEMASPRDGTTVSVGTISGGTTPNVVPASATARVDVRASTMAEARRVERAIRGLQPFLAGSKITVTGGFNRPPMERTEAVARLFHRAQEIGRSLGIELAEGSTGGGSDGNFTAALGIPTLDGLGVMGGGAHAEDEHIVISSLAERAALLATLLQRL